MRALKDDARRLARMAVDKVIDGAEVVCATLTGVDSGPLGDRRFDLAVVDEAAQALEPACWAAIARAERFVLVGDHHQLPPTVVAPEAARLGLGRTLFERLHASPAGARAARMLETQYRMHEAIAAFSSRTFYDGRLVAAPAVARHHLADLPGVEPVDPWSVEPLILVDTSGAGHDEERAAGSTSIRNPGEAEVVAGIVRLLTGAGVAPRALGVISPYALQVRSIRELLRPEVEAGLEVDTADGFQGREREAIVVSFARSNQEGEIGFLADRRRANVALTRARRALILVGDGATLAADPFHADLLAHVEKTGRLLSVFELEADS
jgi:predicted DNA helicase